MSDNERITELKRTIQRLEGERWAEANMGHDAATLIAERDQAREEVSKMKESVAHVLREVEIMTAIAWKAGDAARSWGALMDVERLIRGAFDLG